MEERVERVLDVAALHGHEALVMGAWGCGVLRNDPGMIAELFHLALVGRSQTSCSRFSTYGCRRIRPPNRRGCGAVAAAAVPSAYSSHPADATLMRPPVQ